MVLFTVNSVHLHITKKIQYVCEAISGYFVVLARICLAASTLDYIEMQVRKKITVKRAMICERVLNRSEQKVRNWPSWVDKNCLSDFLFSNMDFSKQVLEEK